MPDRPATTAPLALDANQLKVVLSNLPNFATIIDRERRFLWVNRLDPTLSMEQVIGSRIDAFMDQEAVPAMIEVVERAFREGVPGEYLARGYGHGGVETWYFARVIPLGTAIDGVERVMVLSTDETERVVAQRELARSEERYRSVVSALSEGIVVNGRDGTMIECNAAAERILGLSREQLTGRTRMDPRWRAIHEDGSPFPGDTHPIWVALQTGQPSSNVVMGVHRPDDTLVWITINAEPIFQPGETQPSSVVASFADITEQVRTRHELVATRDRLAAMLQAIPDLLFEINDCNIFTDFRAVDPAMLLVQPEAFLGKRITDVMPPSAAETILAALAEARTHGRSFGHQFSLEFNHEVRWYEISAARERRIDGTFACIALAHDITQLKRTKDEVRKLNADLEARVIERTERLEIINRELEAFTHSVSHDLRGPLRSIDGYCQLVADRCAPLLDDDGKRMLHNVHRSVEQMHELINGLLAYSLIERETLHEDAIGLHDLVQSVCSMFRSDIEAAGVTLIVPPSQLVVTTDINAFTIALRNLIDNAIKFSRHATNPTIEVSFEHDDKHVRVHVKDNGVGFDMRHHDRIFEVFRRLHRDDAYPGTGLGLAMARKAIHRIHGRVWALSAPGQGATFSVELPHASARALA